MRCTRAICFLNTAREERWIAGNHYFISMKCVAGLILVLRATGALFMDQYQANYQHFKAMHLDTCLCRDAFAEKLLGPSTAADDPMSLAQCNSQQLVTCPGTESGFKISYRSIRLAQHHFDDLRCQSVQDVSASVCPEAETTGGCTYQRVAWLHVILKSAWEKRWKEIRFGWGMVGVCLCLMMFPGSNDLESTHHL